MDKITADCRDAGVRVGFATEDAAYRSAQRRGLVGLTGPGQQCGPVELPDGSWAYWMAHNAFAPRRAPGSLGLPRRIVDLDGLRDVLAGLPPHIADAVEEWALGEGLISPWEETT